MTTSVPQPTFGDQGFVAPLESDVLAGTTADINAAFGGNLNPALSTPQGQLASSEAAIIAASNNTFVFLTNMFDPAYSLGRYEQMMQPMTKAILPIWQYWTVGDNRVRPEHRVLHRFAAHADDPVWLKIYPPNGYNCRCSVIPIPAAGAPKDAKQVP